LPPAASQETATKIDGEPNPLGPTRQKEAMHNSDSDHILTNRVLSIHETLIFDLMREEHVRVRIYNMQDRSVQE